jgi:hypothetical protein
LHVRQCFKQAQLPTGLRLEHIANSGQRTSFSLSLYLPTEAGFIVKMTRTPAPTQTNAQRENRRIVKGISNAWRISRRNRRPRGLKNKLNNCYRHALLQSLLHLPRFLNWIRQHREKGRDWPCNTEHSKSLYQVKKNAFSDVVEEANAKLTTGCVPCLLKDLIAAYWGTDEADKEDNGDLAVFRHHHDTMLPIHMFAERFFCRQPDDHDLVLEENFNRSQAYKDELTRKACESNKVAQQDAQELMSRLLGWGCEESLDPVTQ